MGENKFKKRLLVPTLLQKIDETDDYQEMLDYENLLFSAFISPLCVLGSIVNFIVRMIWKDPWFNIILVSAVLFFCGIAIDYLARTHWGNEKKAHHISASVAVLVFILSVDYYRRIGLLAWMLIFFMVCIAITRIDKIFLYYMIGTGALLYCYMILHYINDKLVLTPLFYLIQFFLLLLIMVASLSSNRLYGMLLLKKILRYNELSLKQEEILSLYEEVQATEEELRSQNEKLLIYNQEIKDNEARLEHMAYYDFLTELPNRKMIIEQLELMVEMSKKNKEKFAIVFIDLDNFKKVNDTQGHQAGDQLLCHIASRIKKMINKHDILGRLGGDEFALIVKSGLREEELLTYVEMISAGFQEPLCINDQIVEVTGSFGIAIYPDDAVQADELLKAADTAMYKSKEAGKNAVQFFRKEMKEELLRKIHMENRMMQAIKNHEMFLVYQPQFDTKTKALKGFEALLRWELPEQGTISPVEFIPLAEESGIIHQIGEWVIQMACRKIKENNATYHRDIPIAVNVSTVQMQSKEFVNVVRNIITAEGVNPGSLEMEITESVFINNIDQAVTMLQELKEMGIKIVLDDFGTGYSSLSYLTQLPIDTLKIDKSFINNLNKEASSSPIVGSIISMMHKMDISVVAEGVETLEQFEYLHKEECDIIQGFLLGKPLGEENMKKLIENI